MAGKEIGRLTVRVSPDTDGFRSRLQAALKGLDDELKVKLDLDSNGFAQKVKAAVAGIKETIKLPVDPVIDERQFRDKFRPRPVKLPVQPEVDSGALNGVMARFRAAMQRGLARIRFSVDTDQSSFGRARSMISGLVASGTKLFASFAGGVAGLFKNVFSILPGSLERVFESAQKGFQSVGKAAESAADSGKGSLGALAQALLQVVKMTMAVVSALYIVGAVAFVLEVAGAAITAAWGAAATAIAAAVPAVGLLGVAAGSVMLGLDGIKRAASTLSSEFEQMKANVSATFENRLTPVFEKLRGLFQTVQKGAQDTAISLSSVADGLADVVVQSEATGQLARIFDNISEAINDLRPGLSDITASFLRIMELRSGFEVLTGAVSVFGSEFRRAVNETIADGSLNAAFIGLRGTLESVSRALVGLVTNGIRLFSTAAPGINKALDSLTNFFGRFDWERLGTAVGNVFSGLAEALDAVPPETIEAITRAFEGLGEKFKDPDFQQSITRIIESLPELIRLGSLLSDFFITATGYVADFVIGIGSLYDALGDIGSRIQEFFTNLGGGANASAGGGGMFQDLSDSLSNAFTEMIVNATIKGGELYTAVTGTWTKISEGSGALWDGIKSTVISKASGMVADTVAWIAQLPERASTFLSNLQTVVSETFEAAKQAAVGRVTELVGQVGSWLSQAPGRARAALSAVPAIVSALFESAKSAVTSKVSQIVTNVSNGFNRAKSAVSSAMSRLASTVSEKAGEAARTVSSLPGKIRSGLGNLGSLLVGAGKALINGLLSGIKSAVAGMLSYVGTIAAKVAARKGPISYDRRVLIPQGEALMQGLQRGLESGMVAIRSQMRDLTQYFAGLDFDTLTVGIDSSVPDSLRGIRDAQLTSYVESDDFGGLYDIIGDAVERGFANAEVLVDGKRVAMAVNNVNTRNARRR